MKAIDNLIYLITGKTIKKSIRKTLSGRLPQNTVSKLPDEIRSTYEQRLENLDRKETLGAALVARFSLLTLLFYERLIAENIDKCEAINITSEITWVLYEKLTGMFWIFTRLFSKKPIERVKKAIVFTIKHFPYNSPGYEMEILKSNENEIAYNVYKCPAAEFFKVHQLSELCAETWCDLDYALADKWGVKLERDKTIAKGDGLCTFRFMAKNAGSLSGD